MTAVADPVLQKPDDGGVEKPNVPPLDAPQAPFITGAVCVAEQVGDAAPPPDPPQVHDHGPDPEGAGVATPLPALQRLVVGAVAKDPPFAVPHVPATGVKVLLAVQVGDVERPSHCHV